VKDRISRFDPKLKPEVREREDPSIQCDPPNQRIRERWHFGTFAARSHAVLCLPFAALRRPNLHVSPVPSRFQNGRLQTPITAFSLFLTTYCVLLTVDCFRTWLRFVKFVSAREQWFDRPILSEAAPSDWLRSARLRITVDTAWCLLSKVRLAGGRCRKD
jgi:hypothetical protein